MKKKSKIIIIIGTVLLLAIVFVVLGLHFSKNYVKIDDNKKIIQMAKEYILDINENVEIVETSDVVKNEKLGLIAVIVKFEKEDEECAECVYLSRSKHFDNMYEIQGALSVESGKVIADSQKINGKYVAFVRGVDIPNDISNYSVEELDCTGTVENGWCIEMIETDSLDHYDVTIE
ncbi:MAG: hypothetical protein J6L69_01170 [Lachnospiraceae bacterium]|nr:hypothetical protein [Lachnospiraceae bacterium]